MMDGATKLKCPGAAEFADALIEHMGPGAAHAENRPAPQMQRA